MSQAFAIDPGYWIEEGVLTVEECQSMARELDAIDLGRSRAGARHLMRVPAVARLAGDDRLLAFAQRALGPQAIPFRATLFEKSPRANWLVVWHQDTALPLEFHLDSPQWGPWSTKAGILYAHAPAWALDRIVAVRVHLDACTAESGPLRVIPGSHRLGLLTDDEVLRIAHQQPAAECVVGCGGVVGMRPLLIHSSPKSENESRRRVLHFEYADSRELLGLVRLAIA